MSFNFRRFCRNLMRRKVKIKKKVVTTKGEKWWKKGILFGENCSNEIAKVEFYLFIYLFFRESN